MMHQPQLPRDHESSIQRIRHFKAERVNSLDVKVEGAGKTALEKGRNRLTFTGCLFGLMFTAVAVQLANVSFQDDPRSMVRRSTNLELTAKPVRADIVDRNGVLLATNLPTVNLYADTRIVDDPKAVAQKIKSVLPNTDLEQLEKKLASGSAFIYLSRHLTPAQQYEVNALGIPALSFEETDVRLYPQGRLFAHILGKTDIDNHGVSGLEKHFNDSLYAGQPLQLSVDIRTQSAVTNILRRNMEKYKAIGASAVVQDVRTGEIISMVSLPDFDPNHTETMTDATMFNRASLGVYELGSIFKVFNTAIALESGKVQINDRFDTTEPLKIARRTIRDSHPVKYKMSVPEILAHSSNIGSVRMAMDVGGVTQKEYLQNLGLFREAGIEIPEVGRPTIPAGVWQPITVATVSYGHGIAVSPVQAATAASTVVNGGVFHKATLLKINPDTMYPGQKIFSEKTSQMMRQLMRMVVTDGTGGKADVAGYRVGGKTGTAEKVVDGKYSHTAVFTSFLSMFPADNPRYTVLVSLDEPKGIPETANFINAGWNAAPTAGEIIRTIGPMLGVTPGLDPFFDADPSGPFIMASTTGRN